jgi:hypothetical protein
MKLIHLAVGGLLIATASACSSPSPAADPRPAPAPASTTVPANPYAVPQVITVAYVNSVLQALNHVNGNAARSVVSSDSLSAGAIADLRSIYNDPLYSAELRVFDEGVATNFENVLRPPGDRVTVVSVLISATPSCIYIESKSDLTAVEVHATPGAASEYWQLTPKQVGNDPGDLNPTPWALTQNLAFQTSTTAANPCSASS